jgi:hypothetical protein
MPTYEEGRAEYSKLMGPEFGKLYHLLWNECALMHMRWEEYVKLFGDDPENFEVMNSTAPGFFKSVQDALWESTLLRLCRFTDKARIGPRQTLSLEAMVKFQNQMPNVELGPLIDEARQKAKFARDWRNRRIAHTDFDLRMLEGTAPLEGASRLAVRESLAAIVRVIEAVESHFTGSSLGFIGTSERWGGTLVIANLRLASRLRAERHARLKSGTQTLDDVDWKKWH